LIFLIYKENLFEFFGILLFNFDLSQAPQIFGRVPYGQRLRVSSPFVIALYGGCVEHWVLDVGANDHFG